MSIVSDFYSKHLLVLCFAIQQTANAILEDNHFVAYLLYQIVQLVKLLKTCHLPTSTTVIYLTVGFKISLVDMENSKQALL